jgi:hypothetical protein
MNLVMLLLFSWIEYDIWPKIPSKTGMITDQFFCRSLSSTGTLSDANNVK